ncbi:MAG: hypothetical protein Q9191_006264 [Dirinaria sp. TL-2023a]
MSRRYGCRPPPSIAQRDPLFGLDTTWRLSRALKENRRNISIKQLFSIYGPTFQSKSWIAPTKIYTIEPKNLQTIFATEFSSWGVQPMRLFAFEPFIGKGIMNTDGALWEHSRALIKPTFTRTNITDLHLDAYADHVQRLVKLIPRDGSTVDLRMLFVRLALDSSTEFLFGESIGSLTDNGVSKDAQSFLSAYSYGQSAVGQRIQLPRWKFIRKDRRFSDSCRVAHEFAEGYIAKGMSICGGTDTIKRQIRGAGEPKHYVLAHELIKGSNEPSSSIRDQLLNVFLPAHDATAVTLTNVFFNLARHPDVYDKLRSEILSAPAVWASDAEKSDHSGPKWTFERLKSVKYLQYVINETFRLNPAIGTTTRMALRDTVLPTGGRAYKKPTCEAVPIFVREGSIVTVSFYALHRRPDLFGQDAHIFRPERWETLRPVPWSYMVFGGGPRVCPGQQLALTEVGYCIVQILLEFEKIECRDAVQEFVEVYRITTESGNGAKVALWPVQRPAME